MARKKLSPKEERDARKANARRFQDAEDVNTSQGNSITSQGLSITSLTTRVEGLEAFINRPAGFAALSHSHAWGDLPNAGVHQNERHGVPYITAATGDNRYAPTPHENTHHAIVFLTQSSANALYAPTPHGNAHHSPNFVPA